MEDQLAMREEICNAINVCRIYSLSNNFDRDEKQVEELLKLSKVSSSYPAQFRYRISSRKDLSRRVKCLMNYESLKFNAATRIEIEQVAGDATHFSLKISG